MNEYYFVYIKATTPPEMGSYVFYPHYDGESILIVPKGYIQEYNNAKEWKYFTAVEDDWD